MLSKRTIFSMLICSILFINISMKAENPATGKGIWIWQIWTTAGGNLNTMISQMKSSGVKWVTVKLGDSDSYYNRTGKLLYSWAANYGGFDKVVEEFHNNGILVFGWQFVYSYSKWGNGIYEADVANSILNIPGIDGLIVDAEGDYEGHATEAKDYMENIRFFHGMNFVGFSSFARVIGHSTFPWLEFSTYCDVNMPQAYWAARSLSPTTELNLMESEFNTLYNTWKQSQPNAYSTLILPIGQGGQIEIGRNLIAGEIKTFSEKVRNDGYEGVSLYSYDIITPNSWNEYTNTWLPLLAKPSLTAPKNGDTNLSINLTFAWQQIDSANTYNLQISSDSTFANTFTNQSSINDTSFKVNGLLLNTQYYWRVQAVKGDVKSDWSDTWKFSTLSLTSAKDKKNSLPDSYSLNQNYPNPFNPSTIISYSIPYESNVKIDVYNSIGVKVKELVNNTKPAGEYNVKFNAINLSSGIYFYRITASSIDGKNNFVNVRKMILLK